MTKYNKLTFQGPQTSMSIAGRHFPKGQPQYLVDSELPFPISQLRSLGIRCDVVESEERPVSVSNVVAGGSAGMLWKGTAQRKATDWGTFVKGQPRFDIPVAAIAYLSTQPGWEKVGR